MKDKIQDALSQEGLPPQGQCLTFKGQPLAEGRTLEDYEIEAPSVHTCIIPETDM